MKKSEVLQAIDVLEMNRPFIDNDLQKAIDISIKSLKQKIPQKLIFNGKNWYRCPNGCEIHKKQFEIDYYCPKCGQAIDLSETEQ